MTKKIEHKGVGLAAAGTGLGAGAKETAQHTEQ